MTVGRISQLDQVTELTRDISLPLAPIGADVLAIILEALADAWDFVKTNYPHVVDKGTEPEISALLVTRLNASLGWSDLLSLVVSSVHRGSESVSFDGSKFEGRPDLQFTLTGMDTRFQLVGESKIIDVPNKKTASLYRNKGIQRFVNGEYAWGNREGIIVAYVRCGSKLDPTVLSDLPKFKKLNCSGRTLHSSVKAPIQSGALGTSTHGRQFPYVHKTTSVPGHIELWHLWLET